MLDKLLEPMSRVIDNLTRIIGGAFSSIADFFTLNTSAMTVMVVMLAAVLASAVTSLSPMFAIVGALNLALIVVLLVLRDHENTNSVTSTKKEKELVPYDDWPNDCYACGSELGQVRAQFVVQKGESVNKLKAVGVCDACARTHSALLDYSDRLDKIYNMRGEPEEI